MPPYRSPACFQIISALVRRAHTGFRHRLLANTPRLGNWITISSSSRPPRNINSIGKNHIISFPLTTTLEYQGHHYQYNNVNTTTINKPHHQVVINTSSHRSSSVSNNFSFITVMHQYRSPRIIIISNNIINNKYRGTVIIIIINNVEFQYRHYQQHTLGIISGHHQNAE